MKSEDVLKFWFEELEPADWWKKNPNLDRLIKERFGLVHKAAAQGECFSWRSSPEGRLAEILVLDQFSRNIFRNDPRAFAQDAMALVLAQEAVAQKADQFLPVTQRAFCYMPYMHSESQVIHEQALVLFKQPGLEGNYNFELQHKRIIDQFGRYPHRNQILGRSSSPEELAFLQEPGSSF